MYFCRECIVILPCQRLLLISTVCRRLCLYSLPSWIILSPRRWSTGNNQRSSLSFHWYLIKAWALRANRELLLRIPEQLTSTIVDMSYRPDQQTQLRTRRVNVSNHIDVTPCLSHLHLIRANKATNGASILSPWAAAPAAIAQRRRSCCSILAQRFQALCSPALASCWLSGSLPMWHEPIWLERSLGCDWLAAWIVVLLQAAHLSLSAWTLLKLYTAPLLRGC